MEQNIDDGKVACEICGERFKIITTVHLKKHKISLQEYKEKYPNAKLTGAKYSMSMKQKGNDIFKRKMEVDTISDMKEPVIEESVSDDITPEIEEIAITDLDMEPVPEDKIGQQIGTVLNIIKTYFPKTEKNYFIRKINLNNQLAYEFITDYADPMAKIIFDFPNTFWHNNHHTNIFRNRRIKEDGWKVFTFNSKNPDFEKLKSELEKIY